MGKPLLTKMLNVDVYCGKAPSITEVLNVRDLIVRTQAKAGRPYYGHCLWLMGDFAEQFRDHCRGISLNFSMQLRIPCHLGIVIGKAPPSFYTKREQVVNCPEKRLERR
ncbi:hypothetical protein pEaSNUABM5_00128 [Erwinia phage pEa_SNUABM_5]|uniref:Uncharacterized protein n=1 Tax=Erwinia phage pEa_SNUABM_5 TaxID=2797313 RepID=A0A7T8IVM6_9CAUD|nr:hypothetical protein MPK73_gp128 [Erwinia phage pEa_SNUABM_5]QQO90270.1 hypothetical protein pEaSNUABM5_00128 [Erwinia phage pEa_SNUABM_5]